MKMTIITLSLIFSLSLTLTYTTNAFDITQILNQYPEFSSFNSYLTQTNLAASINARQTITVLVVDNGNLASLSSNSLDTIRNILSVHIVLDYYDVTKLQQLSSSSALLTTLFQATGLAKGQQGFLNVTHPSANSVAFGSAMPGSTQGSSLVKLVMSQPYNISILQISNAIIPQGIDGTKTSSPPSKSPSATATPPPPPPPPTTAPPQPSKAPTPSSIAPPQPSKAPTSAPPTKAATPSTAPGTPSTAPGSAPAPGAPASAPAAVDGPASSEEPASTTPAADKPKIKSAAAAIEIGLAVVGTMALSTLYLASTI